MTGLQPLPPRGVYGITPASLCHDLPALSKAVAQALDGGLAVLQYRDKCSDSAHKLKHASALKRLCANYAVPLIINDDVALAKAVAADGVHLGLNDAELATARTLLGPNAIIGATCADSLARAAEAAAAGASYLAFGAFYPSRTKPQAPQPPASLLTSARRQFELPICAIGGINGSNAKALVDAGAHFVAAIESIFSAPDITAAVFSLRRAFP